MSAYAVHVPDKSIQGPQISHLLANWNHDLHYESRLTVVYRLYLPPGEMWPTGAHTLARTSASPSTSVACFTRFIISSAKARYASDPRERGS